MNSENRNLILAIVLSVSIFGIFHYFFDTAPAAIPEVPQQGVPQAQNIPIPVQQPVVPVAAAPKKRVAAIKESPRVEIKTPMLQGSINLKGARIDDLLLTHYRETIDAKSPAITLFSPQGTENPYYADFGWSPAIAGLGVPNQDAIWSVQGNKMLTSESPVTLTWKNAQGLRFERLISVDENYLFTITDKIVNESSSTISVAPYGLIGRGGNPPVSSYYVLYEGPLGVLDGVLQEITYDDLKSQKNVEFTSVGGWIGMTDKYWLAALIPDVSTPIKAKFSESKAVELDPAKAGYQVDFVGNAVNMAPGASQTVTHHLYAGAKVVHLLDAYEKTLNVAKLDRAVDFGWFYLITKPMFYALTFIYDYVGNFGISLLILTVLIKILFLPLANKSYKTMARMRRMQPEIEKLQARYKDDKLMANQELMKFYKKHQINPMAGCLPMLIQIPVFFALYKVLFISLEMRHTPFFGWVQDLSAPDPTTVFNLFGLIPWDPPSFLLLGAWPLIMGLTMYVQQKMSPQPADPVQARMMLLMPIMFTYLLAQFPVGLVIYWAWSNLLTIAQQWFIMSREKARNPD